MGARALVSSEKSSLAFLRSERMKQLLLLIGPIAGKLILDNPPFGLCGKVPLKFLRCGKGQFADLSLASISTGSWINQFRLHLADMGKKRFQCFIAQLAELVMLDRQLFHPASLSSTGKRSATRWSAPACVRHGPKRILPFAQARGKSVEAFGCLPDQFGSFVGYRDSHLGLGQPSRLGAGRKQRGRNEAQTRPDRQQANAGDCEKKGVAHSLSYQNVNKAPSAQSATTTACHSPSIWRQRNILRPSRVSNERHLNHAICLDLEIVVQVKNACHNLSPLFLSRGIATGEKNDTSVIPSLCRRSHTVSKLCLGVSTRRWTAIYRDAFFCGRPEGAIVGCRSGALGFRWRCCR